jgi:hypothetical protein
VLARSMRNRRESRMTELRRELASAEVLRTSEFVAVSVMTIVRLTH